MSDTRRELKKITIEYKNGKVEEFDVERGFLRLDTARIMEGVKVVKGYLQLFITAEVAITPNHAPLASDPPESLPDASEEALDD